MDLQRPIAVILVTVLGACAHAEGQDASGGSPAVQPVALWQTANGGVRPMGGSIAATVPCQSVELSLKLVANAADPPLPRLIGAPSACRNESIYIGYLRSTLFIEGLDAGGARLFVATGMNPLHQDLEAPPPASGGTMSWHSVDNPAPVVTTLIQAPITPALVRLRWYDVDANSQPHLLGETAWNTLAKP